MTVVLIIILILLISAAIAGLSFAPWVPARKKDLERIFRIAGLKTNNVFYDLGCGDGRTVIYAAKKFNAKSIGIEISLFNFLICKIKQLAATDKNITFKFKNLFKEDLVGADVVYFFGMPDKLKKLKPKLEKELKSGAKIISYAFSVEGWQPVLVDKPSEREVGIYLYVKN